jgi:hypothetical protein
MTLIVGILCQDSSVVIGSDGAATLDAFGHLTTKQPVKKLSLFHNCMIVGVSGSVGLSQRISAIFTKLYDDKKLSNKKPVEAMVTIRERIWEDCLKSEIQIAADAQKVFGQLATRDCSCSCIAAVTAAKQNCLIQFDQQGHPTLATEHLPFVAIGSGQQTADPFLAFLRHIYWPDRLPKLSEGIFAAFWTIHHAIRTSPGGIAEPKQFAVLEMKGGNPACRELVANEILSIEEAVTSAENYLKDFNKPSPDAVPIPKPPEKSPQGT